MVDLEKDSLPYINSNSEPKNYTLCKDGDIAFADASEDTNDVAKAIEFKDCANERVVCGLHTIHGRDNNNITEIGFKGYAFSSDSFHKQIRRIAQGTKIYSINSKNFNETFIGIPSKEEQTKIASLLSLIDERISTQNKIIEDLKKLKSATRDRLFYNLVHTCNNECTFKDVLNYEQPSKYIVSDTEYCSDESLIPVLTANKAFILGYTNEEFGVYDKGQCIIFDDFTMDVKFVSFDFKVKSSAIKILTAKNYINLRFVYEYILYLNLVSKEHKRHYISEIEPINISIPNKSTQFAISSILSDINLKIDTTEKICLLFNRQKQYLLQQMFI